MPFDVFTLRVHPFAELFPPMSGFDDLVADIRANGLKFPVMLDAVGEMLLDGRNRRQACQKAGVDVKFERLAEGEDLIKFIRASCEIALAC